MGAFPSVAIHVLSVEKGILVSLPLSYCGHFEQYNVLEFLHDFQLI